MDFGIARALASGATTMTQTSAVIGTAQYLSPEQARGEAVDARSDVYAAGCVLFELVVGHPPFVGDSPVSVAYQHVREDPRAPSDINHEVPPDVDAIVLKALAKNPLNRYQSAQEMRADALRAVAGRPVMATPVMSQAETMALTGPMRQPQAATTMNRQVTGMSPRQPERKTSSWVMAVLAALGVLAVVALGIGLALARDNGKDDNSQTPATAKMPNLIGESEADARAALAQQKFESITVGDAVESNNCDDPVVAKQSPSAGTSIQVNQPVTYQMCKAPDQVVVPGDLIGRSQGDAENRLAALQLKSDINNVDSDAPKGTVVGVEKSGQQVDPGTTITLSISRGNQVPVPNVVGQTEEIAKATLTGLGFNVSVKDGNPGPNPGIVTAQSPTGDKKLAKGKTVTITVTPDEPNPGDSGTPDPSGSPPPGGNGGGNGVAGLFR
jgi:serine/threonine-protein kinase